MINNRGEESFLFFDPQGVTTFPSIINNKMAYRVKAFCFMVATFYHFKPVLCIKDRRDPVILPVGARQVNIPVVTLVYTCNGGRRGFVLGKVQRVLFVRYYRCRPVVYKSG